MNARTEMRESSKAPPGTEASADSGEVRPGRRFSAACGPRRRTQAHKTLPRRALTHERARAVMCRPRVPSTPLPGRKNGVRRRPTAGKELREGTASRCVLVLSHLIMADDARSVLNGRLQAVNGELIDGFSAGAAPSSEDHHPLGKSFVLGRAGAGAGASRSRK